MVRKVEVVSYRSEWESRFLAEKDVLLKTFTPKQVTVHHIGSTSVPSLAAKPIVDIMIESNSLEIFDQNTQKLEEMGYEARGENGIPGRRYFVKFSPEGERLIHLHAFQTENPEINRHLVFRDYLREHPTHSKRYGEIKLEAANKFPWDIDKYISYKDPIIKELEKLAYQWKKKD
ncbi:GrpB family protein [Bacillus sp. CGMCC 1.16607]|uniref:GrpB family protein n=1 Tax=Bacillus sp. CGMCC 1.16607 TaxID=3351842 RepID=UPI0036384A99